jgi:hypothetical protein
LNAARIYRYSTAARWLPRTLAAAVMISSAILSARIYTGVAGTGFSHSRTLVILAGAACALVIVRSGGMVRAEFSLTSDALQLRVGKHTRELPYEMIVSLNYEPPFVRPREWLPAMVLLDRFGKRWRVPALLADGESFVTDLTSAVGRDELRSFASAYRLTSRMGAARNRLIWGYSLAFALILAAVVLLQIAPGAAS